LIVEGVGCVATGDGVSIQSHLEYALVGPGIDVHHLTIVHGQREDDVGCALSCGYGAAGVHCVGKGERAIGQGQSVGVDDIKVVVAIGTAARSSSCDNVEEASLDVESSSDGAAGLPAVGVGEDYRGDLAAGTVRLVDTGQGGGSTWDEGVGIALAVCLGVVEVVATVGSGSSLSREGVVGGSDAKLSVVSVAEDDLVALKSSRVGEGHTRVVTAVGQRQIGEPEGVEVGAKSDIDQAVAVTDGDGVEGVLSSTEAKSQQQEGDLFHIVSCS